MFFIHATENMQNISFIIFVLLEILVRKKGGGGFPKTHSLILEHHIFGIKAGMKLCTPKQFSIYFKIMNPGFNYSNFLVSYGHSKMLNCAVLFKYLAASYISTTGCMMSKHLR